MTTRFLTKSVSSSTRFLNKKAIQYPSVVKINYLFTVDVCFLQAAVDLPFVL